MRLARFALLQFVMLVRMMCMDPLSDVVNETVQSEHPSRYPEKRGPGKH